MGGVELLPILDEFLLVCSVDQLVRKRAIDVVNADIYTLGLFGSCIGVRQDQPRSSRGLRPFSSPLYCRLLRYGNWETKTSLSTWKKCCILSLSISYHTGCFFLSSGGRLCSCAVMHLMKLYFKPSKIAFSSFIHQSSTSSIIC